LKLNSIEKIKQKNLLVSYINDLESIDLNNLNEEDRFYLKTIGIYNFKVTPELFMLRIRITAGDVSIKELELILNLSTKYNGEIILTSRAQIEIHGINSNNILALYYEIKNSTLNSYQTLIDNVRNVVTNPIDKESLSNKIEVLSLTKDIESVFLKKEEYLSTIPRKFNIAISGNSSNITSFFNNDLYFALAKKNDTYGFNIYLGGKNNQIAISANIFIKKEDVKDFTEATLKAYNQYGLRESRNKTRLFNLIEEKGIEKVKAYIQEFFQKSFEEEGKLEISKERFEEFIPIKKNRYCFRYQTNFGKIKSNEIEAILSFAKKEELQIRLGVDQNIYIVGLKNKVTPFTNTQGSANILSCAGEKLCFFSIFDTKEKSKLLNIKKLEQYNITVGYSGCLKGCSRHRFTDIGLISIRTNTFGATEQAVRFFLGAQYSDGTATNRLIFWAVPLRVLNPLIDIVIDEFAHSGFKHFEEFSKNILNLYDDSFLSLWFLCKIYTKKKIYLSSNLDKKDLASLFNHEKLTQILQEEEETLVKSFLKIVWDQ
jgi:ferredoxin-nitrite reductase